MEAARDAVDAVPVERLLHRFEVLAVQFLRIVELVVVHQVAEPLDGRPHLLDGRRLRQFRLVAAGIEPGGHPAERPDTKTRLHPKLLLVDRRSSALHYAPEWA